MSIKKFSYSLSCFIFFLLAIEFTYSIFISRKFDYFNFITPILYGLTVAAFISFFTYSKNNKYKNYDNNEEISIKDLNILILINMVLFFLAMVSYKSNLQTEYFVFNLLLSSNMFRTIFNYHLYNKSISNS